MAFPRQQRLRERASMLRHTFVACLVYHTFCSMFRFYRNHHQGDWNRHIYRVSQEERSIFREVIVSVILSKNVYMNMCPIPNGFRDTAI